MRILITGQPKSGTSALYLLLKQALPEKTLALLEPSRFDPATAKNTMFVLAKTLLFPGWVEYDSFDGFDRKILIVRDPRDTIISQLLWWAIIPEFSDDKTRLAAFTTCLQQKETSPTSISFLSLIQCWSELANQDFLAVHRQLIRHSLYFADQYDDYFIFHYEDLIDHHISPLITYLGFDLAFPIPDYSVARTKTYGNWRHWFRPEDVRFFKPLFADYMRRYGYTDSWDLSPSPTIRPEHGSQYVLRVVNLQLRHQQSQAQVA